MKREAEWKTRGNIQKNKKMSDLKVNIEESQNVGDNRSNGTDKTVNQSTLLCGGTEESFFKKELRRKSETSSQAELRKLSSQESFTEGNTTDQDDNSSRLSNTELDNDNEKDKRKRFSNLKKVVRSMKRSTKRNKEVCRIPVELVGDTKTNSKTLGNRLFGSSSLSRIWHSMFQAKHSTSLYHQENENDLKHRSTKTLGRLFGGIRDRDVNNMDTTTDSDNNQPSTARFDNGRNLLNDKVKSSTLGRKISHTLGQIGHFNRNATPSSSSGRSVGAGSSKVFSTSSIKTMTNFPTAAVKPREEEGGKYGGGLGGGSPIITTTTTTTGFGGASAEAEALPQPAGLARGNSRSLVQSSHCNNKPAAKNTSFVVTGMTTSSEPRKIPISNSETSSTKFHN